AGAAAGVNNGATGDTIEVYVLVVKRFRKCYPVFVVDPERYARTLEVETRVFHEGDPVVNAARDMLRYSAQTSIAFTGAKYNLTVVGEVASGKQWRIVLKYINRQNMCYAVM